MLINVDEKIISKVLAARLERVLPSLVHAGQVGFVENIQVNIQNVQLTIYPGYYILCGRVGIMLIPSQVLCPAEKAFDKVEFPFLFYTLKKFEFGPSFMHWIQLVYTELMATVFNNGVMSTPFNLSHGTRQCSPLSPQISALFLELLAIALSERYQRGSNGPGGTQALFECQRYSFGFK